MRPAISSCLRGAAPLYGTCVIWTFAARDSASPSTCMVEPGPVEPYVYGLKSFTCCIASRRSFPGVLGCAVHTNGTYTATDTPAKSASTLYVARFASAAATEA